MRHVVGRRSAALVGGTALGLLLVATAVAGSTQVNPTYDLKKLKGSVTADGSSTVGPYTTAAAELFAKAGAKNVKVTVGISGTGGGFQRFCKGEIDLSDASRPIKATEAAECIENGVGSRLNAVEIRNPKTGNCVAPSKTSAQSGQYRPPARPLFIYAKSSSFERREVQAFLDFVFDNEVAIAKRADFISLTPKQFKKLGRPSTPR